MKTRVIVLTGKARDVLLTLELLATLYGHVKRQCEDTLSRERTRRQNDGRVLFLEHRLQVIEQLNTPELIRERGTYQTYWIDPTTRKIPRWKPNRREREVEGIIQLALMGANP